MFLLSPSCCIDLCAHKLGIPRPSDCMSANAWECSPNHLQGFPSTTQVTTWQGTPSLHNSHLTRDKCPRSDRHGAAFGLWVAVPFGVPGQGFQSRRKKNRPLKLPPCYASHLLPPDIDPLRKVKPFFARGSAKNRRASERHTNRRPAPRALEGQGKDCAQALS